MGESGGEVAAFGSVSGVDFSGVAGIDEGLHVGFRALEGLDDFPVFVEGIAFGAMTAGQVAALAFDEVSEGMVFVGFGGESADFEDDGDGIIEVADLGVCPLAVVLVAESRADGDDGGGEFRIAGHPTADIELVGTLVAEVAVAVIELPVPVVVEFFAMNGSHLAWAAPEIVIDRGGSGFGSGDFADGRAGFVAETAGEFDFADLAGLDEIVGFVPCGFGATLEAVLDDDFVFLCGVSELAAFPDVVGNGFLDVSMFAVGGGGGGDEGVSVVGRGDDDGIDFRGFTGFAEIRKFGDFDVFFLQFGGVGIEDGGIDIAEGDEFRLAAFQQLTSQTFATTVETDEADPEVAVR